MTFVPTDPMSDDDALAAARAAYLMPYDQVPWLRQTSVAVRDRNMALVDTLLAEHLQHPTLGDVNGVWKDDGVPARSLLNTAVAAGSVEMIQRLAKHPGIDLDAPACVNQNFPVLWHAARLDHPSTRPALLIGTLIDLGADPQKVLAGQPDFLRTLPAVVCTFGGSNAGSMLDVLRCRCLMPIDREEWAQLLIFAATEVRMNLDSPTSALNWLLDHHAPTTGVNEHGWDLGTLANKFSSMAPKSFERVRRTMQIEKVRVEQAVMLASVASIPAAPSLHRPRL